MKFLGHPWWHYEVRSFLTPGLACVRTWHSALSSAGHSLPARKKISVGEILPGHKVTFLPSTLSVVSDILNCNHIDSDTSKPICVVCMVWDWKPKGWLEIMKKQTWCVWSDPTLDLGELVISSGPCFTASQAPTPPSYFLYPGTLCIIHPPVRCPWRWFLLLRQKCCPEWILILCPGL